MLNKLTWNLRHINDGKGRDSSIVLFGAWFGNRFADNSRFLYQYLSENKEKLGLTHVVWVTRNKNLCSQIRQMGYECYMMDSAESVHYHKKAKYHIICDSAEKEDGDILTQYSNGAVKINLWHGLGGIKGVEFASKGYALAKKAHPMKYALKEAMHRNGVYRKLSVAYGGWGDCYYLSTTPLQTRLLGKYFYRDPAHFIEAGYPRNDQNYKLTDEETEVIEKIKKKKNIILYVPTFRDKDISYQVPLDNPALKDVIREGDYYWIEKKHNFTGDSETDEEENILKLDSAFDISTIMPYVDLVITDYSSVSWDALYYGIPVFFYIPDMDLYESADRGFVLPKEKFIIGQTAYSTDELKDLIEKYQGKYKSSINCNYAGIKKKLWGEDRSCEDIWNKILEYL